MDFIKRQKGTYQITLARHACVLHQPWRHQTTKRKSIIDSSYTRNSLVRMYLVISTEYPLLSSSHPFTSISPFLVSKKFCSVSVLRSKSTIKVTFNHNDFYSLLRLHHQKLISCRSIAPPCRCILHTIHSILMKQLRREGGGGDVEKSETNMKHPITATA